VWALTPRAVATTNEPGPASETLLAESRTAFDRKQWNEALEPTRTLVERFPTQHLYMERLALVYQGLGRHAEEAGAWEQVLKVIPASENACHAIGNAYQRAGNVPAAIDALRRCVDLDPRNTEFMYNLANAYRRSGQAPAAERTYRDVLALEPTHVDGAVALASTRLHANQPGEALALVEPVLKRFPDSPDLLLTAGLSYHRLNRTAEARRAIARGLELAESYADLHIAMGIIEIGDGHMHPARTHFERFVTLEPARRDEVQVWLDRTRDVE
jgi:Flp pilus assembly protein TadD